MPIEKICEHCQTPFRVQPKYADRKFCSRTCHREHESNYGRPAARVAPIAFTCRECGNSFPMMQSYVTAYNKKFGRDPLYCSRPCSAIGRRKDADERHKTVCKNCGKEFYKTRRKGSGTIYNTQELCSKQCKNEWVSKQWHAQRGTLQQITRRVKRRYVVLRIPAQNGTPAHEILEHRYVMEQKLGRKLLTEETVHHINGDRQHNDPSNLELFSSRHGPGQRVVDKVNFAIEILTLYPEFARARGKVLHDISPDVPCLETRKELRAPSDRPADPPAPVSPAVFW